MAYCMVYTDRLVVHVYYHVCIIRADTRYSTCVEQAHQCWYIQIGRQIDRPTDRQTDLTVISMTKVIIAYLQLWLPLQAVRFLLLPVMIITFK
jgi:hypothetical protein